MIEGVKKFNRFGVFLGLNVDVMFYDKLVRNEKIFIMVSNYCKFIMK